MKACFRSALLGFTVTFLASSFIAMSVNDPIFTIKIEGATLDLKEGIKPSELSRMTIEVEDANLSVEEFEVILARGSRPVVIPGKIVKGNSYNLAEYAGLAQSGDRLVIDVKEITGLKSEDIPAEKRTILIPIK